MVEELPRPTPKATEILVRMHASTVSAADQRTRSKKVPAGLAIPASFTIGFVRPRRPILGMDAAGVVEEVGAEVTGFQAGDAVVAMLGSRFGGHAEYAVADQSDAVARVNGASGAVGSAAVQLARAVGAHVTGVCSAANVSMVTALEADRVIDYGTDDFVEADARYDIVMDCVGNAPVSRVHPIVEPGGAILHLVGDLRTMLGAGRNGRAHGMRVATDPGPYRSRDLEYLLELAETGRFRPAVDRRYPLEDTSEAHRFVDTGRKRGNVILTIAG